MKNISPCRLFLCLQAVYKLDDQTYVGVSVSLGADVTLFAAVALRLLADFDTDETSSPVVSVDAV